MHKLLRERKREREIFQMLVHSPEYLGMGQAEAWSLQFQPGLCPTWVAGNQILGPTSTASCLGTLAGS